MTCGSPAITGRMMHDRANASEQRVRVVNGRSRELTMSMTRVSNKRLWEIRLQFEEGRVAGMWQLKRRLPDAHGDSRVTTT